MRKTNNAPPAAETTGEAVPARDIAAEVPVFDRASDDLPWPQDETLPADDEGNILPGNDADDDNPNDNGKDEPFDPEDLT